MSYFWKKVNVLLLRSQHKHSDAALLWPERRSDTISNLALFALVWLQGAEWKKTSELSCTGLFLLSIHLERTTMALPSHRVCPFSAGGQHPGRSFPPASLPLSSDKCETEWLSSLMQADVHWLIYASLQGQTSKVKVCPPDTCFRNRPTTILLSESKEWKS